MSRLGSQGHNILFVDPPINTGRLFLRQLLKKMWPMNRIINRTYEEGDVVVFSPLDWNANHEKLALSHIQRIKNIAESKFDPKLKTLLWVYHIETPGLEHYLGELSYDLLIYDCVDNYAGFPRYDTKEKRERINRQEQFLAEKADIVFATAPGLVEKLKKYNQNVFFTPNVGDYEKFVKSGEYKNSLPEDMTGIPRPRVGFYGAVDEYKFDRELVRKTASDYPSYSFIIIGPIALKDRDASIKEIGLDNLKNVYFLGTKEYADMPKYMAGFDVFIIPYQLNDYTVGGCFPVKFHEGLAAGVPTVVTNLPAYAPFSDVCYISKSYNEFSQNIRRALEEDSEQKIKERQKVAKENSWDGKVRKLLEIVNNKFSAI